jgi:hypothetical protein
MVNARRLLPRARVGSWYGGVRDVVESDFEGPPMPLKLGAEGHLELRRFFEEATEGAPLPFREPEGLRGCLGALRARPEDVWALRRYLHARGPGWVGPLDDHAVFDRAERGAIGDLRLSMRAVQRLGTYGHVEQDAAESLVLEQAVEVAEEVCVPCQRAAASARALREAAAAGSPFIAEM